MFTPSPPPLPQADNDAATVSKLRETAIFAREKNIATTVTLDFIADTPPLGVESSAMASGFGIAVLRIRPDIVRLELTLHYLPCP